MPLSGYFARYHRAPALVESIAANQSLNRCGAGRRKWCLTVPCCILVIRCKQCGESLFLKAKKKLDSGKPPRQCVQVWLCHLWQPLFETPSQVDIAPFLDSSNIDLYLVSVLSRNESFSDVIPHSKSFWSSSTFKL